MTIIIKQIGNRFALTAAHCLYDDNNEELLPASSLSVILGVHDRSKEREPHRLKSPFNAPNVHNFPFFVKETYQSEQSCCS